MKKIIYLFFTILLLICLTGCDKNTDITNAQNTNENTDNWEIRYYMDQFNQPTSKAYVVNKSIVSGAFSNTATTDSELDAQLIIEDGKVSIRLWEYGDMLVKSSYSKDYNITMRRTDGTDCYLTGRISSGGDRINVVDKGEYFYNPNTIIEELQKDGNVGFYITEEERLSTKYLFIVETDNFADTYKSFLDLSTK